MQRKNQRVIIEENTLKTFYHLGEQKGDFNGMRSVAELASFREINPAKLKATLRRLLLKGQVTFRRGQWGLTRAGHRKAAKVVRLHRLWELYLTKYVAIAADHVHDDAETIEHILTPELERELEHQLGYPDKDPHDTEIPKD